MNPPLVGICVLEFEGLGPCPLAGKMLCNMGAAVTVITRSRRDALDTEFGEPSHSPMRRGKTVRALDLKRPEAIEEVLSLIAGSDALIEGNRPGVMERLGLGPGQCGMRNPRLVYGRMTGWGQDGPLAQAAGHDLNYVALTGLLSLAARPGERPVLPPTVLGDAAGALGLAFGIVCAVIEARSSGRGRVVDAAIVDIAAMLGGLIQWVRAAGAIDGLQPSPFYDSPFYDVYACADGGFISVAALEPQFYALLLTKLGLLDVDSSCQYDRAGWPALKARLIARFASEPRAHWSALLEGTDVCFAPVLSIAEAVAHPHNVARGIYSVDAAGAVSVAAAPRMRPIDTFER
jgi:alpha-methylacyl-CoA racemase